MDLSHYINTLPPLPDTIIQFEKLIQDDNRSIADISRLLAKDPMMVANILKQANAPIYGFSREITSLDQAVALFGIGNIRGFVLASIILAHEIELDFSAYNLTPAQFVTRAQRQQAIMSKWLRGSQDLITLASASFMVFLGQIIITRYLKENQKLDTFKTLIKEGMSVEEAEIELVGMACCQVSALMFSEWKFEPFLVETIDNVYNIHTTDSKVKQAAMRLKTVTLAVNETSEITPESRLHAMQNCQHHNIECTDLKMILENSY